MKNNIVELINTNAERFSPYINRFVNHLPMGQSALYKMTNDVAKVEEFTKYYVKNHDMEKVKDECKKGATIEECVGERNLYKPCLDLIREKLKTEDLKSFISGILNKYTWGLSSGLYHTTIRLAYAIEGYELDNALQREIERALAYYITGYRQGIVFDKKINKDEALEKMRKLMADHKVMEIQRSNLSRGEKLEKLYQNKEFLESGFIIEGKVEDKVRGILTILIPAFYNSNSIVMLHALTGLHATVVLKDYFDDYGHALDILSSAAITHLLAQKDLNIESKDTKLDKSWEEISKIASQSKNVHALKLAYSCKSLDRIFKVDGLKYSAYKRALQ